MLIKVGMEGKGGEKMELLSVNPETQGHCGCHCPGGPREGTSSLCRETEQR